MDSARPGELLREARTTAGMSQVELAISAGTTQSVISVYESGRRQPSIPTLAALVAATGQRLDVRVAKPRTGLGLLAGPLGRRLRRRRTALLRAAADHGVLIIGVFGSVARGEERPDSDVDLLVELPLRMGMLALGRAQQAIEDVLGGPVDLVPESDLKPGVRVSVLADLVRL